jgi:hypothetical protein
MGSFYRLRGGGGAVVGGKWPVVSWSNKGERQVDFLSSTFEFFHVFFDVDGLGFLRLLRGFS